MPSRLLRTALSAAPLLWTLGSVPAALADDRAGWTGETLTLLYATDVRKSVAFYEALGFAFDFYYDYEADEYVLDWQRPYPPEYAELRGGSTRLGLTTHEDPESGVYGGGVRHYFLVDEVHDRFARARALGIVADPEEVEIQPWMEFFTVADPDGHRIVLGKKNEAYYAAARDEIEALRAGVD